MKGCKFNYGVVCYLVLCDFNWSVLLYCVMIIVVCLWFYQGQNEELFDFVVCVRFLMGLLGFFFFWLVSKVLLMVGNKLVGFGFRLKSGSVGLGVDKVGVVVVVEVYQLFVKDERSFFGYLNKDVMSGFLFG